MIALASYDTASVIQTTTANARIASIRWPATGKSVGNGKSSTPTITSAATTNPTGNLMRAAGCAGTVSGAFMSIPLILHDLTQTDIRNTASIQLPRAE